MSPWGTGHMANSCSPHHTLQQVRTQPECVTLGQGCPRGIVCLPLTSKFNATPQAAEAQPLGPWAVACTAPVQDVLDVAPTAVLVEWAGHALHTALLPPSENSPTPQGVQGKPPVPGSHTGGQVQAIQHSRFNETQAVGVAQCD